MPLELTDEHQKAIDAEALPRLVDPRTGTAYVLVRADIFERLQALLGEDVQPRDAYSAVDRAFSANWNDPKMDDYDRRSPAAKPRSGWDAVFKEMAGRGGDKLLDGDALAPPHWDDDEWSW